MRQLNPYFEAYQLRVIEEDKAYHRLGSYFYEAVGYALGGKPYRKKPYYADEEERMRLERMTEEEKLEQVEKVFEMLASGNF